MCQFLKYLYVFTAPILKWKKEHEIFFNSEKNLILTWRWIRIRFMIRIRNFAERIQDPDPDPLFSPAWIRIRPEKMRILNTGENHYLEYMFDDIQFKKQKCLICPLYT